MLSTEERALRSFGKRGSLRDFRSDDVAEGTRAGEGCENSDAVVTASKMCAGMSIAMETSVGGEMDGMPQFMIRGPRERDSCWIYTMCPAHAGCTLPRFQECPRRQRSLVRR